MKNNLLPRMKDEQGFALVIALLFSVMLLMLGAALMYSMSSFFRALSVASQRSQNYYIGTSGIEKLRDFLWDPSSTDPALGALFPRGCHPGDDFLNGAAVPNQWCGLLVANPADPAFRDQSGKIDFSDFTDKDGNPLLNPAGDYRVYLKDNDDGDGNYSRDDDAIVIAVAQGNSGSAGSQTTVEAMLMFTARKDTYAELGGSWSKDNESRVDVDNAELSTIRQGTKPL